MKKEIFYTYLGMNGIINSPVYLEGIYSIKKVRLIADANKGLTKDGKHFQVIVEIPEAEINEWREVSLLGQN